MKRKETMKQREARLTAFERDLLPAEKPGPSHKALLASGKILWILGDHYEWPDAPTRESLIDLLTDVHHCARIQGHDLTNILRMAEKHAESER